jgi:hypothetical protein
MKFREIGKFTGRGNYHIQVEWNYLPSWIKEQTEESATAGMAVLDLNPDFQRDYVWTREQKVSYLEYILRGGQSGRDLYFNCKGWMDDYEGPFVIVDGKQRFQAVLDFLNNEMPVFGYFYKEFTDRIPMEASFNVHINNLKTREEVLTWYVEMNTGGTVHTQTEIDRVWGMIVEEKKRMFREGE